MTNNGGDMHGSQFFITLGDNLDSLDGRHSVFGEVAEESYEVCVSPPPTQSAWLFLP